MSKHWVLLVVGVLLDLVGSIWMLQGMGALPGSFMTGDPFWAAVGGISVIVGMGLVVLAMRQKVEHG